MHPFNIFINRIFFLLNIEYKYHISKIIIIPNRNTKYIKHVQHSLKPNEPKNPYQNLLRINRPIIPSKPQKQRQIRIIQLRNISIEIICTKIEKSTIKSNIFPYHYYRLKAYTQNMIHLLTK